MLFLLYSPIEQFQIFTFLELVVHLENIYFYPYSRINLFKTLLLDNFLLDLYVSLTQMTFFYMLLIFFLFFFLCNVRFSLLVIPSRWFLFFKRITKLVEGLIVENIGPIGLNYLPYVFFIFTLVSLCNFFGMIPYSYTITSHLVITLTVAGGSFLAVNMIALQQNGLGILQLFLPSGTPLFIIPFIVLVEITSYIARVFSLGIRLFANMMAGHTLLKILSSYAWPLLVANSTLLNFLFFIPFCIICLVTCLELAIAFLQAYVFSILVCLYLNDALNVSH